MFFLNTNEFFQSVSVQKTFSSLESSAGGLSEGEARKRVHKFGLNQLKPAPKEPLWKKFFNQFTDFVVLLLIAAALVSGFLGETLDAIAIIAIVFLNAIIGFVQEYRADKAIEALKKLSSPKARVLRDGEENKIDSFELVPGDVIILEEGDKIPADSRLFESVSLEVDEAALTGESIPTKKESAVVVGEKQPINEWINCVFTGTIITRGRGKAVVIRTGMATELGKITQLVSETQDEETPLQKNLEHLGKQLGVLAISACVIIFLFGWLVQGTEWLEMFLISVSLAVAAIPEGLPAVVTIALAVGVQRMARKNAIIRRLPAVETLGAATVICTDKTGTLTRNELTVRKLFVGGREVSVSGEGYALSGEFTSEGKKIDATNDKDLRELISISVLCNNSNLVLESGKTTASIVGDPTEACLLVMAKKAGVDYDLFRKQNEFASENPFDSKRKMMSVVRKTQRGQKSFVKGAPEVVLEKSSHYLENGVEKTLTVGQKKIFLDSTKNFASQALRVLGFAYKTGANVENEEKLVFVGLAGIMDLARPEAITSVAACHSAGIRVVMITGDNPETARAIAQEIGLLKQGGLVVSGVELNSITDAQLREIVRETSVYARVSPEHKLRIVSALKENGEVVAMTGDGVNDAPAIKKADIGISMGITGTDVAKESSDMVISDDNFASIEKAVEEGRVIYDNILKAVKYLLSCNIGEVLTIFIAIIVGLKSPLAPIQILWMNLVTDGAPALALSMDARDEEVMKRKPRDKNQPILTKSVALRMASIGLLMALCSLGVYWYYLNSDAEKATTMAFTTLVFLQLMYAIAVSGSRHAPAITTGFLKNKYLIAAFTGGLILQLLAVNYFYTFFKTTPLALGDYGIAFAVGSLGLIIPELWKIIKR